MKCVIETNRKGYSVERMKSNDLVWQTVGLSVVFRACDIPWSIFFFFFKNICMEIEWNTREKESVRLCRYSKCKNWVEKKNRREENFESRSRDVYEVYVYVGPKFKVLLKSLRHVNKRSARGEDNNWFAFTKRAKNKLTISYRYPASKYFIFFSFNRI